MDSDDAAELLFFDTFSHDLNEHINLDLVQFPNPVYITELRIIPLGTKIQGEFPGGVRLGATNPSHFRIEFFVNDLGKPGASTFENFGGFEYNETDCINIETCPKKNGSRKILTDGLVLRGWYTTITLAVYGVITKNLTEEMLNQQASPNKIVSSISEETSPIAAEKDNPEWINQDNPFYGEPVDDIPKDPRKFSDDWSRDATDRDIEMKYSDDKAEVKKGFSISPKKGHDISSHLNSPPEVDWAASPDRFSRSTDRRREKLRSTDVDKPDIDDKKYPHTPPAMSPKHSNPESPDKNDFPDDWKKRKYSEAVDSLDQQTEQLSDSLNARSPNQTPITSPQAFDDETSSQGEQFEPILSDDDIGDELGDDILDLDYDEGEFEDVLKIFNPFVTELQAVTISEKELADSMHLPMSTLKNYMLRNENTDASNFEKISPEAKVHWVHIVDQFLHQMGIVNNGMFYTKSLKLKLLEENVEMKNLLIEWLKIGLNLNYAMQQNQEVYTIRHIKAGARLLESISQCDEILRMLLIDQQFNFYSMMFEVFHQPHTAVSIKLMLIKTMHCTLDSEVCVDFIIGDNCGSIKTDTTVYQQVIQLLKSNPQTRIKFALKSFVKKLNLFESLKTLKDTVFRLWNNSAMELDESDVKCQHNLIESCLEELINTLQYDWLSYSQPKRFLPVRTKFDLYKEGSLESHTLNGLFIMFEKNLLMEVLLNLITHESDLPQHLYQLVLKLMNLIMSIPHGIEYCNSKINVTNLVVKCLLGVCEESATEEDTNPEDYLFNSSSENHQLGIEIAYKMNTNFLLNGLAHSINSDEVHECLQLLYGIVTNQISRYHVVNVITMEENIMILIDLIEKEKRLSLQKTNDELSIKSKSSIISYCVDLLDAVIRHGVSVSYLEQHGDKILDLVKNHDQFESSVSAMFQELAVHLKPLEVSNIFNYNNIGGLIDTIRRSVEYITTFPGDLITSLRILKFLAILPLPFDEMTKLDYTDLKFDYVLLQFYSLDGTSLLTDILQKLTNYFDQPAIHSATFVSNQGQQVMYIILPIVQILRRILSLLIQARDVDFRDLTAIEPLLKTYTMTYYVPQHSGAYGDAQQIQQEILATLLAYTQPIGVNMDTKTIHKSLWTQMIGEILKYIQTAPYVFQPCLNILSELLPLPLPIPVIQPLSDTEVNRMLTERQLWSAYLHPLSPTLSDVIQMICMSSNHQLIVTLSRVCIQLADLAANMSLVISKSVVDLILSEIPENNEATPQIARLLGFLSELLNHASVKVFILSILPGKLIEMLTSIITATHTTPSHVLGCENIHLVFQNLLDVEISMVAPAKLENPDLALACVLPTKEVIADITTSSLDSFLKNIENPHIQLLALRTLYYLTDHNITFYHLQNAINDKKESFNEVLKNLASKNIDEMQENTRNLWFTLIDFLRGFTNYEIDNDNQFPRRTMLMNTNELAYLIDYPQEESLRKDHPINVFKTKMEVFLSTENTRIPNEEARNVLLKTFDELLEQVNTFLAQMNKVDAISAFEERQEPTMLQAEGIVTQYLSRPIYLVQSNTNTTQLTTSYWLGPSSPQQSETTTNDAVTVDLQEIINSVLQPDTNIVSEYKKILHLSASPQASATSRVTAAPCFRTQRVKVEPTTGRPEKKPFVTRGRGFTRAPPTRGDLFRSRPPNTSRPPSLHVDDFLALETCGAQPTGPTGYNKISRDMINIRGTRGRGRGFLSERPRSMMYSSSIYRSNLHRNTMIRNQDGSMSNPHVFRSADPNKPHFSNDYGSSHFGFSSRTRIRGRSSRIYNKQ